MPVMVTTTQSGQSRQAEIGQKRTLISWIKHSIGVREAPPLSCIKSRFRLVQNPAMVKYH